MIAILTGDIVNSRSLAAKIWMPELEKALGRYSKSDSLWEIFRGDSFQVETEIENAIEALYYIRFVMKSMQLDARIAIGIGEKEYTAETLSKSNGSAFVNSGDAFEKLKKQTFAIKTPWTNIDDQIKIIFDLSTLLIQSLNANVSKTVQIALENPGLNQNELAQLLNKKQSQISRELKKAGYDEILKAIKHCTNLIQRK